MRIKIYNYLLSLIKLVFLTNLLKLNHHNPFHAFLLVSLVNTMKKLKHSRVPSNIYFCI